MFEQKLLTHLQILYGPKASSQWLAQFLTVFENYQKQRKSGDLYSEKDVILITYADQVQDETQTNSPLETQATFVNQYLKEAFSGVHLLPFYPFCSDGGFSVIDYYEVAEEFGTWDDLKKYDCDLMFDGVFNHISHQSNWFQQYLKGDPNYQHHFLAFESPEVEHLEKVVRPRSHPLLTPYETPQGTRWVWTTFSEEQVDLNLSNPQVLLDLIKVMLFYFEKGARYLRVDAIPFFWKELGTTCSHHPKTHEILKTFRTITETYFPDCILISESNVPHVENITYYGNGRDEAHMIYNFSLPPLLLHAIFNENAEVLSNWSRDFSLVGDQTTILNMTATHDGIGVRPLEGLVSQDEIDSMCQRCLEKGGQIGYKTLPDGSQGLYELNITWASFLMDDRLEPEQMIDLLVNSHGITFAFPGIPGVYLHNLFATQNWQEGFQQTDHKRDLNRRKFFNGEVQDLILKDTVSKEVFSRLTNLLRLRRKQKVFQPLAPKIDLDLDPRVWAFQRQTTEQLISVYFNVSSEVVSFPCAPIVDIITNKHWSDHISRSFPNDLGTTKRTMK